jgi:YggT family protein
MQVRTDIADFLSALIWVYTICIFAYIVSSLVLSFGIRLPYSRPLDALLGFLRDVSEPFLRVFRRLGLQIGPLDLSPILALFVLRIVGGLVVGLIRP